MESKEIIGKLTINVGEKPIELNILSGVLDRSCTTFNFDAEENIDEYNLLVDVNDCAKDVLRDIEDVSSALDKVYSITLSFDGEEKQGDAKISQSLALCGVSLDVELHSRD